MNENILLTHYKNLSKEELKGLPADELAEVAHEALQNWDKLNQRLNQDSTNSDRSPSSDSPEAKAKRRADEKSSNPKQGTQKQGAQPRHKAVSRPLIPLCEDDVVVDCIPQTCASCRKSLAGQTDSEPYRQQHYDFEIIRRITEYRKHRIECFCCGHTTEGTLPKEAIESAYGPAVAALVGVLTGLCQMSRRTAKMFIEDVLSIPISLGSVSNLEKELTEASQPVIEEIEFVAQNAEQGNADETGFGMENGKQGWLWVLVTPFAVLFRLFVGRGQEHASKLLGCFQGILTTDRWGGYNHYPREKRQICWAHLMRDFKAMTANWNDGEAIGTALRKEARAMFRLWHRFKKWKATQANRGVNVSMTVLESQIKPIRDRVLVLLEEGAKRGVPKCGTILKVEPLLWTFSKEDGVEPTNNSAERSIRPAVLWKKRSFGVESERGGQYAEAMLSIKATAQLNGINSIKFLRELIIAFRSKTPAPNIFSTSAL